MKVNLVNQGAYEAMRVDYTYTIGPLDLEDDLAPRGDKYEVVVRFTVLSRSPEEAEDTINNMIQDKKLEWADNDESDPIFEYDVEEVDVAAL